MEQNCERSGVCRKDDDLRDSSIQGFGCFEGTSATFARLEVLGTERVDAAWCRYHTYPHWRPSSIDDNLEVTGDQSWSAGITPGRRGQLTRSLLDNVEDLLRESLVGNRPCYTKCERCSSHYVQSNMNGLPADCPSAIFCGYGMIVTC